MLVNHPTLTFVPEFFRFEARRRKSETSSRMGNWGTLKPLQGFSAHFLDYSTQLWVEEL
jgi:hypothetical protein